MLKLLATSLFILSTSTHANFETLVNKSLSALPNKMINALPRNIEIQAKVINKQSVNLCEEDKLPSGFILGQYGRISNQINISKGLIESYTHCPDKLEEKITRTIIHELFHAYDRNAEIEKNTEFECMSSIEAYKKGKSLRSRCKKFNRYNRRSTIISDDTIFKVLAQIHGKIGDNFKGTRVLDSYELSSKYEYSAVNFESFILDPEYQCRRPTLNKYFTEHFNVIPFPRISCNSTKTIYTSGQEPQKFELDISRVYQIHYLHASEGEAIISSFGHSMIRVVMCKEGREIGPDCLNDLEDDVVLSFRANVHDIRQDAIKGISGEYPSQLFVFNLRDIISEYNILELRDLYSYPLNLTYEEKEAFLNRSLETYWEYLGSYKFFTNNCATETYNLIVGVNKKLDNKLFSSITPNGILKDLMKYGFINNEYKDINNLDPMNVFRSNFRSLNLAHKTLFNKEANKGDFLELITNNINYLDDMVVEIDKNLSEDLKTMKPENLKRKYLKTISAIYTIKRMIFSIKKQELISYPAELILKAIEDGKLSEDELLETIENMTTNDANSYGIPTISEVDQLNIKVSTDPDYLDSQNETAKKIFDDIVADNLQEKIDLAEEALEKANQVVKLQRKLRTAYISPERRARMQSVINQIERAK